MVLILLVPWQVSGRVKMTLAMLVLLALLESSYLGYINSGQITKRERTEDCAKCSLLVGQ